MRRVHPQEAVWRVPVGQPFVDVFHVVEGRGLLVGALAWDNQRFTFNPADLSFLDLKDGHRLWNIQRDGDASAHYAFVAANDSVLVIQRTTSKHSRWVVYALADGRPVAELEVDGFASATLSRERLYVVRGDHIWALDVSTGRVVWEQAVAARVGAAAVELVVVDDKVCFVGDTAACVLADNGEKLWDRSLLDDGAVGKTLALTDALAVCTDKSLTLFDVKTGKTRWRTLAPVTGCITVQLVGDGFMSAWLAEDGSSNIRTNAIADGKARWSASQTPLARSAFVADGGEIMFTSTFQLHILDGKTGRELRRAWLPWELWQKYRSGEAVVPSATEVVVIGDAGTVRYERATLREVSRVTPAFLNQWGRAHETAKRWDEEALRVANGGKTPSSIILADTSSPGIAAAQARIRYAYASTRHISESSRASSAAKVEASQYRQSVISSSISSAQASIAAGKVAAALNLGASIAGGALAIVEAMQLDNARSRAAMGPLDRYRGRAADLRLEGTPPDHFLGAYAGDLYVYASPMSSVAHIVHSDEGDLFWQHIAAVDVANHRVLGAHVSRVAERRGVQISKLNARYDLDVESYDLAVASPAESNVTPPGFADIRSGKLSRPPDINSNECWAAAAMQVSDYWYAAITGNNVEAAHELRRSGSGMTEFGLFNISFIEVARAGKLTEMTRWLEEDAANTKESYALWDAARAGDLDVVRSLLSKGVGPNGQYRSRSGKRVCEPEVILGVVKRRGTQVMQALIDHGADVNLLTTMGKTALDARIFMEDEETVRFLRAHGAKTAAELALEPAGASAALMR